MSKFNVGDRVWGAGSPFWMTVAEPVSTRFYRCTFRSSGRDAGTWAEEDLTPYEVPEQPSLYDQQRADEARLEAADFVNEVNSRDGV